MPTICPVSDGRLAHEAEPQRARGGVGQARLEVVGRRDEAGGLGEDVPPALGQRRPRAVAVEQRDPGVRLEPRDSRADRRLAHRQQLRRLAEGTVLGHGDERANRLQTHRHGTIIAKGCGHSLSLRFHW